MAHGRQKKPDYQLDDAGGQSDGPLGPQGETLRWSMQTIIIVMVVASISAALVSDWFVHVIALVLQSPVQIALALFPCLVLLSNVLGGSQLTLVLPTGL